MILKLAGLAPPHPKQQAIIDYILEPDARVKLVDAICGRGFGKSETAIMIALAMAAAYPGCSGEFLEPDWRRVRNVFLRKWTKCVPKEIYTLNQQGQCITLINGSKIYYRPRNVTGNQEAASDGGRGPDLSWIIDDEAAMSCNKNLYVNNLASLRENTPVRFYLTISTFRYGDYELLVDDPAHRVFIGRTSDNPYLPPGFEEQLRMSMPPEVAALELDSLRGTPEGAIWGSFGWTAFPDGNLLEGYRFDPSEPWWMACDLGNHGSYQIYQCPQAKHPMTGADVLNGRLWCMTEEWLSNDDGGLEGVLPEIIQRYCGGDPRKNRPQMVYCGHDLNTPDAIRGSSAANVFGRLHWNFMFPGGPLRYKDTQRSHMMHMIWERRFVVAAEQDSAGHWRATQHRGEGKKRGVLEVMRRDKYPTERGKVFDKDKSGSNPKASIEDDRDAMLYGAICWRHPSTYGIEMITGSQS